MTIVLHIPHWWPWALACLGSFVTGVVATLLYVQAAFTAGVGRIFGW